MDERRGRLRRVLFATDRSTAARAAQLVVARFAAGREVEVLVLHVCQSSRPAADGQGDGDLAAAVATGLLALAVDARSELREALAGQAARTVAGAADDFGADLVVLGSRGRSDLGGLLPGPFSAEVLGRVRCPLLLVRAGRRRAARPRRILVPVAGDENVSEVVATVAAIAEPETRAFVLHLLAPGQDDTSAARLAVEVLFGLRRRGLRARGRSANGDHSTRLELVRAAKGYGADLVVMSSRRIPTLAALLQEG